MKHKIYRKMDTNPVTPNGKNMVFAVQLLGLEQSIVYLENVMMALSYQENITQTKQYQKR